MSAGNFSKAILLAGIDDSLPHSHQRALRLFNALVISNSPLAIIISLMLAGWTIHPLPFASAVITSLVLISIPLLHRYHFYLAGQTLYFTTSCIATLIHVYYYGSSLHIELAFISILSGTFVFVPQPNRTVQFAAFVAACYLLSVILLNNLETPQPVAPANEVKYIYYLVSLIVIIITLSMLKYSQENYEKELMATSKTLESQKEEIETQRDEIILTNGLLHAKNQAVASSITYAHRIQQAMFPALDEIRKHVSTFFLYFKPRDVVSGDFYWFLQTNNKVYLAIADCTGHGVPGALMSMLGGSMLNQIVQSTLSDSPRLILKYLDIQIISMLSRGGVEAREGMEITLCVFDKNNRTLRVASASRPFILMRDNVLHEFKGSRNFIGFSLNEKAPFEEQLFNLQDKDTFYFYTDGITDQYDRYNSKKYSTKRLKELVTDIQQLSLSEQGSMIEKEFLAWKQETPQTDDMLLMGIRF